jgi:hypothetical protein
MDGWSNFWYRNKPLYDKMIEEGNTYKPDKDKGLGYFVNKDGDYVSFPVGYVTGIGYDNNGNPKPYYVSIKESNGWRQHSFRTFNEALEWGKTITIEEENKS